MDNKENSPAVLILECVAGPSTGTVYAKQARRELRGVLR